MPHRATLRHTVLYYAMLCCGMTTRDDIVWYMRVCMYVTPLVVIHEWTRATTCASQRHTMRTCTRPHARNAHTHTHTRAFTRLRKSRRATVAQGSEPMAPETIPEALEACGICGCVICEEWYRDGVILYFSLFQHSTTPHNKILPDCFTPPNAKVERGSASTCVLLSLG